MGGILAALNVTEWAWPPYASNIVLELWRRTEAEALPRVSISEMPGWSLSVVLVAVIVGVAGVCGGGGGDFRDFVRQLIGSQRLDTTEALEHGQRREENMQIVHRMRSGLGVGVARLFFIPYPVRVLLSFISSRAL